MLKKIGKISVDAGCVLLADPCYFMKDEDYEKEVVAPNWSEHRAIRHSKDIPGKGILVSSGYGDGYYDVYADIEDGRVHKVVIQFI